VVGEHPTVVARLRAEDLAIAPSAHLLPDDALQVIGTFIDSQFGGRHMDVVVEVSGNRLHGRVPLEAHDGFARRLQAGDRVAIGFGHVGSVWFTADDQRIEHDRAVRADA
jgi:hypothetical protein